jgi:hypothetical protein
MTIKLCDVRAQTDPDFVFIDLLKLVGKQVKEIVGDCSREFGDDATFRLIKLVFGDGTEMWFEGEHDFPYVVEVNLGEMPNFDQDTLNALADECEDEFDN